MFTMPLQHPELTKVVGAWELEITEPYRVRVRTSHFQSGGYAWRITGEVTRMHTGEVFTRLDGIWPTVDLPNSKKSEGIRAEARTMAEATIAQTEEMAIAWLENEAYVELQAKIEHTCRAQLEELFGKLKVTVERLRSRAADAWLEVGSSSTASLSNCEKEAAIAQAHLAAAVQTWELTWNGYVDARMIAELMAKDAGFKVSLYV